jgi:curved DNA-binding protein CbpA
MRFSLLSIGLLAILSPLTAAWSKEGNIIPLLLPVRSSRHLATALDLLNTGQHADFDTPPDREIFRIRDEINAHEGGPGKTFYDILGISSSASLEEVTKAYRKLTRSLHPDKVKQNLRAERAKAEKSKSKDKKKPGVHVAKAPTASELKTAVKKASEAQARLSLIANILRGAERDRYDHFLANGFPVWKGTGYYYNRYRPGLGTVMAGILIVGGGGFHYLALYMSWKRHREFLQRYITYARNTAWGDNLGIPSVASSGAGGAASRWRPMTASSDEDDSSDSDDRPQQPMNRREKRQMEREKLKGAKKAGGKKAKKAKAPVVEDVPAGPTGAKKRVVAENGKVLIVDSLGEVWLEEQDEDGNVQEFLLDVSCPRLPGYISPFPSM